MKNIFRFIFLLVIKIIGKHRLKYYILDEKEKVSISLGKNGYLNEVGWWNSYFNKKPLDSNLEPIPWVTYSFIDFIKKRLHQNLSIFEFGSGSSTLFWAKNVGKLNTVEHDQGWYNLVIKELPQNVNIKYINLVYGGEYCKSVLGDIYDIIVIDGRDRVNCCINSINAVSLNGIIVLDDSERAQYKIGIDTLLNNGFKRLDFWGFSPGLFYNKCTTIFYRNNNCLNI